MVVGRLLSYWEGKFSGAMLNFGRILIFHPHLTCTYRTGILNNDSFRMKTKLQSHCQEIPSPVSLLRNTTLPPSVVSQFLVGWKFVVDDFVRSRKTVFFWWIFQRFFWKKRRLNSSFKIAARDPIDIRNPPNSW